MIKGISISLAFLLLFTSVGAVHNTHYCGDEAVESSFSLGAEELACGMEKLREDCAHMPLGAEQLRQKPCCENEHQLLRCEEEARVTIEPQLVQPVFLKALVLSFVFPLPSIEKANSFPMGKAPPLPQDDLQVLFQSFLI